MDPNSTSDIGTFIQDYLQDIGSKINTAGGDVVGRDKNTTVYLTPEPEQFQKGEIPRQVESPGPKYVQREGLEEILDKNIEGGSVVCVHGLSGNGKLNLVQAVVTEEAFEERFPDGTLFCDLNNSVTDILYRLILPFEPSFRFNPKYSTYDYSQMVATLLKDKHVAIVVDNVLGASKLQHLHFALETIALVFISDQRIQLTDQTEYVEVPEMTEEEAVLFLHRQIHGDLPLKEDSIPTLNKLAKELHYIPTKIEIAADMILHKKYEAADFLKELQQNQWVADETSDWDRFHAYLEGVYQNLPRLSQEILPFLGVFGAGPVTASAIATISRHPRDRVNRALIQLKQYDLVQELAPDIDQDIEVVDIENPFQVKNQVREFAERKLREMLPTDTDRSIEVIKALMAEYYLAQMAGRLWQGKWEFLNDPELNSSGDADSKRSEPAIAYKYLDTSFDQLLLANQETPGVWNRFFVRDDIKRIKTHLYEAFDWAIDVEDWELVRRFQEVNFRGAYRFSDEGVEEKRLREQGDTLSKGKIQEHTYSKRRFVHIHDFNIEDKNIFGMNFKAVRLLSSRIKRCEFIFGQLCGVQIQRATWDGVKLVGLEAPALSVIDSQWYRVDLRMGDLRGAHFENCTFLEVDFRGCQLDGAVFHNCKLIKCDFRRKSSDRIFVSSETAVYEVKGL